MVLAAKEGFKMRSVDIFSAFTYGELNEVIYMKQSEGYHQRGPNVVYKLHKSLYGLKQSARQWNKKLYSVLDSLGFKYVLSDASIYIYSKGEVKLIVPIFINDITLVSKDDTAMDSTIQKLSKHFKLWDLDTTTFLLSVQVSQSYYIDELLKCFNIEDCNPVKTSLSPGSDLFGLVPTSSQQEEMCFILYLAAVGSL